MPTFTPPTYQNPYPRDDKPSLWRYYEGVPTGYSVLITSGVASTYPGVVSPSIADVSAADSVFLGGRTYTVTSAEQTILEAADYTVDA